MLLCPGKGLVLPNQLHIDQIATNVRFLLIPLQNVEMSKKSPFAIHKALIGIGGEPKTVKRLRSGDILIETHTALQTKSFLLANTFLDSPVTICPHKSLNTSRGVISESDLLSTPESKILEGFSDQGCQRFGHSQTSCRSQLTCSRCASVGHASTDCSLEPKCINCSQLHTADSKLCPKWKTEKQIQEIKTNKNITYVEARKLIVPQLVQTYAKAAKPSIVNNSTQTDENITKIKCSPLNLLQPLSCSIARFGSCAIKFNTHSLTQPLSSLPKQNKLISTPVISISSSSTQAELLPSTSSKAAADLQPGPPIPMSNDILSNNMFTPIESSSNVSTSLSNDIQPPYTSSTVRDSKQNSKTRIRKRKKELLKKLNEEKIEIKMAPYRRNKPAPTDYTTDEKDIITYDVEEDELEQRPNLVQKDGRQYWKGSLLLTPTRLRK
ncbi:putative RNA-directed DNA polymerase from transposon BS [Trichonephila clavipes]|nr:putative RNA-directed DNA polymerase from transposon BS [Trichonephila clavipes]